MLERLKNADIVIGAKQVKKALTHDRAECVFLAADADDRILQPLRELCKEKEIEIKAGFTKKELGEACSIEVGAAAAAIIK